MIRTRRSPAHALAPAISPSCCQPIRRSWPCANGWWPAACPASAAGAATFFQVSWPPSWNCCCSPCCIRTTTRPFAAHWPPACSAPRWPDSPTGRNIPMRSNRNWNASRPGARWCANALLALPEGERLLTDLRHLGELLAEQESMQQGLDGLHAWLREMRLEGSDGDIEAADERQLRIESDARRVQLLTIHASKGLEFPIVFLPLAWRIRSSDGKHAPELLRYHDATGHRCIDLGSTDFIAHRGRHFHEDLQERLRLLYVAMTRAVHGLHVYWVDRGPLPDSDDQ